MRISALFCATILLNLFISSAAAQVAVDTTFTPILQSFNLSSVTGSPSAKVSLVQPDGKILVGGKFRIAGSTMFDEPRSGIARFNPDGTLDASFDAGDISTFQTLALPADGGTIEAIKLQPDGKILIGGYFRRGNETFLRTVERLNPNGSLDTTFQAQIFDAGVYDIEIQPDGKIIVGGRFMFSAVNPANGQTVNFRNLARLNADGSFDFSFAAHGLDGSKGIILLPDGKITVANDSQTGLDQSQLIRFNTNGSTDAVLATFTGGGAEDLEIQPDGKYVAAGSFTHVNGTFQRRIARINQDGSLDTSLTTPGFTNGLVVLDAAIAPDGKIVIGGDFQIFSDVTRWRVARLNPDGSVDSTFNTSTPIAGNVATVSILPDGRVFIGGAFPLYGGGSFYNNIGRVNTDGTIDQNFNGASVLFGGEGFAIRQQPDGKILIGGNMEASSGLLGDGITRYNIDGTPDTTFVRNPNGGTVLDIELQSDGKILIVEGRLLFRLNADGARDTTFSQPFVPFSASIDKRTEIKAIAVQPDNKILVGGQLITGSASSPTLSALARLNPNGTRDTTFPLVGGIGSGIYVYDIAVQPDGKIVIGGNFSQLNGQSVQYLARVNPDGTIDNTFNASVPGTVKELEIQPDGKIVFTSGTQVLRVNPNGSPDAAFSPATFDNGGVLINLLEALTIQPNGKILVGGNFVSANGVTRYRIARLNPNGSLDGGFDLPNGANDIVYDFAIQTDGKILAAGAFTRLANLPRIGAARLIDNTSVPTRTVYDFDGDGKADISVYRNGTWHLQQSTSGYTAIQFGLANDRLTPGDFDGDGKTDLAVYRDGVWYLMRSQSGFASLQFGIAGDTPQAADFDGDGKSEIAVYRASGGTWYIYNLANNQVTVRQFGIAEDKAAAADYTGDGKADAAVFRPSSGVWYVLDLTNDQTSAVQFGANGDKPVVGDFDGDGKSDYAVYRAGTWYVLRSRDGVLIQQFGVADDIPTAADYDGDGKADISVFRPSSGVWYVQKSQSGLFIQQFGLANDIPIPQAFMH